MERVGQHDASSAAYGRDARVSPIQDKPRTALILYGSETGNAQDVAEEVGRLAERLRFDTTVLDMDSCQLRDILKPTVTIFALSTTGQGEMPQNARLFWKTLLSGALRPGILRKVRFSSFGLGDSSYARFNVAHRMLCGRMQQLGGQMFCERGEGNEQHPEGHSAGLREWIVALNQKFLETFPLTVGLQPIAEDQFLEPKWKLDLAESSQSNGSVNFLGRSLANGVNGSSDSGSKAATSSSVPSPALIPVKQAYIAELVANQRITAPDHFQDVRLMDLRLDESITYAPGAVAVVYPKNFPTDVQDFINLMSWQDIADKRLTLHPNPAHSTPESSQALSPLRQLDLSHIHLTLRWLLENVFDIMSIPRRSFFASLAHFAGEATEDEAYQKERLLELANPELIDELWDYTTRPKRTILEVMMDFTTLQIPWQYCLSVLPMMKGRQFSIASGGHLRRDEQGRTRVQLLVAIADPPSPIIKYRRRYGVCTRYIASLQPGQKLNIGMQEGYLDVQPEEMELPVIMIGPGTGIAPMRAMTWQRLLWSQQALTPRPTAQGLEGDILIFGCRTEEGDHFFRREWDHLCTTEGLQILTAFSRDQDQQPRQYVQDLIRIHGGVIRDTILEKRGKVYVCGSSGNMPKGVREALVDVLVDKGGVYSAGHRGSREEAEAYLDRMEKEGRYKQETW